MTTIVELPARDSQGDRAMQRGVFLSDATTTDNEDNGGQLRGQLKGFRLLWKCQ